MDAANTLIVDWADLPSLVALATQPAGEPFVLWHPHVRGAAADVRKRIVKAHAEVYSTSRVVYGGIPIPEQTDRSSPRWWIESAMLIDAMRVAQRFACTRVIWPAQVGDDFDVIGPIVERATLVSGLIARKGSNDAIVIDLPLVDLTDEHVVELADDCAAQMKLFWPCERAELVPCGDCDGCRRWRGAFETAGPRWPWEAVEQAQMVVA